MTTTEADAWRPTRDEIERLRLLAERSRTLRSSVGYCDDWCFWRYREGLHVSVQEGRPAHLTDLDGFPDNPTAKTTCRWVTRAEALNALRICREHVE